MSRSRTSYGTVGKVAAKTSVGPFAQGQVFGDLRITVSSQANALVIPSDTPAADTLRLVRDASGNLIAWIYSTAQAAWTHGVRGQFFTNAYAGYYKLGERLVMLPDELPAGIYVGDAINAARNAVDANGCMVLLPGDSYTLSATSIILKRGTTLRGLSRRGTTIQSDGVAGRTFFTIQAGAGEEDILVADLELRINHASDVGFDLANFTDSLLDNVNVRNNTGRRGTGIKLRATAATSASVYRNTFRHVRLLELAVGLQLSGVGGNGPNANRFDGVSVVADTGITIDANCHANDFQGCRFENNTASPTGTGIQDAGVENQFTGCFVEGWTTAYDLDGATRPTIIAGQTIATTPYAGTATDPLIIDARNGTRIGNTNSPGAGNFGFGQQKRLILNLGAGGNMYLQAGAGGTPDLEAYVGGILRAKIRASDGALVPSYGIGPIGGTPTGEGSLGYTSPDLQYRDNASLRTVEATHRKGAANGYPTLNGDAKVVEDPANAQAAAAASKIPVAGVGATLDGDWLPVPGAKRGGVLQQSDVGALTDNTGQTPDNVIENVPDPADGPLAADILRDDLVANTLPAIERNLSDLADQVNAIRTALRSGGVMA